MAAGTRSLEYTPTWTVATTCTVFVVMGLLVVLGIEKIEGSFVKLIRKYVIMREIAREWLKRAKRKPLVQALDKMKEELMLLGFISLMLTVFQNYVASICLKTSILEHWTPCDLQPGVDYTGVSNSTGGYRRRLLTLDSWPMNAWGNEPLFHHGRMLAVGDAKTCKEGYDSFVSAAGLHKLHIFIFVLACVHLVYSVAAMLLASLKVNQWKRYENEAKQENPLNLPELSKAVTMERNKSFVEHHTRSIWERNPFLVWIVCFFRQFGQSVTRSDYLSLRLGFITTHNTGHSFDFHSYIIRSLEDEYKIVVGISATLWFCVVIFLLFNINGTNLYFYLSLAPPVLVLIVGTKLQHIIASLALEHAGITQGGHFAGSPLKPRDDLFWFNRPQLTLSVIHFVLFQNAFEMATFIWFVWQFSIDSCLLNNKVFVYVRIGLGVLVQIVCSYSTLPVYAIVSQMGSHFKQAIFKHHVKDKLHHWRKDAKKRLKHHHDASSVDERNGGSTQRSSPLWSDDDSSPGNGDSSPESTIHCRTQRSWPTSPLKRPTSPLKRPTSPLRPMQQYASSPRDIDVPGSVVELSKVAVESDHEISNEPSYDPSNIPKSSKPFHTPISIPKTPMPLHSIFNVGPRSPMPAYSPTNIPKSPKEELPKKFYDQVSTDQPEEDTQP